LEATGEADHCFCASPGGGSDRDTAGASLKTSLGSYL
jgi:hypothetical protein